MRPSRGTPAMVPLHSEVGPAMRQHPGPWRHLQEQVLRVYCTNRKPVSDRRRVFLVSEALD